MGVPSPAARLADFDALRARILEAAPVDPPSPEAAREALAARPDASFAALALAAPRRRPLVQPRGGFARFEDQRRLTLALAEAGADFIPLTIDSHTRHNDYRTAQVLLERSEMEDQNLLNGYPLVNHGHRGSRRLFEGVSNPVSLRHGTPDARLLIETALATGITEIEGGPLTYTIPYSRGYPLSRAIVHWQYCDRLAAELSTPDRPINRESFGVLTATMVPPCIVAAVELCELLLAAEQGVTSYSVSFGQTGSLLQDLALARVLREASGDLLARFGFAGVATHLVYHQWMGAFPWDYERATALIAASAQIAALVGADKVITKTKEEARGIPAVESNCEAVRLVRYTLERAAPTDLMASPAVALEAARIRAETDVILDAVFAQPQQAFWASVAQACATGVIDVPFAPHEANANLLTTRRGRADGIYIVDPGRVPLPPALLEEERALAAEREAGDVANRTFQALMRDINLMAA
jgi:methylaspartate mutase epsilon subunit